MLQWLAVCLVENITSLLMPSQYLDSAVGTAGLRASSNAFGIPSTPPISSATKTLIKKLTWILRQYIWLGRSLSQLTDDLFARESLLGDGRVHGSDVRVDDVGLAHDHGRRRRWEGAEGGGVALVATLVQLNHCNLLTTVALVPVWVLKNIYNMLN